MDEQSEGAGRATPAPPTVLPSVGQVYLDSRGPDRALRVTWHHEVGVVVLSLWRGTERAECVGTFQLAAEEVPGFVEALTRGLAEGYTVAGLSAAG